MAVYVYANEQFRLWFLVLVCYFVVFDINPWKLHYKTIIGLSGDLVNIKLDFGSVNINPNVRLGFGAKKKKFFGRRVFGHAYLVATPLEIHDSRIRVYGL